MDLLNYRRVHTNPARPHKNDDPESAGHLSFLISANQTWRTIDRELQKHLPAYLHGHFQTACVRQNRLILLADSNTAAARIKMLLPALLEAVQKRIDGLEGIDVRLRPHQDRPSENKTPELPAAALEKLNRAAEDLSHHQGLAQSLRQLLSRHRK